MKDSISEEALTPYLFKYFGLPGFREGQYPLIRAILEGKDVLGLLPTGGGKSICFQLPALLCDDVTIVVSPLKSLMKDQVTNLKAFGVTCGEYIDSTRDPSEKQEILQRVHKKKINILYLSPERLQDSTFLQNLIEAIHPRQVAYFVIDEAHCVSEWGHDFRPAYRQLEQAAKHLRAAQRIAVTATASPQIRSDILNAFHIPREQVYTSRTMDRQELSFHVLEVQRPQHKEKILKRVLDQLNRIYPEGSGLIFTIYASPDGHHTAPLGTAFIHQYLKEQGIASLVYHGRQADRDRASIQDAFKEDKISLLVATKGFGMGIDKPNIRYVIHLCYPDSLEAYYQEAGRGGRDRKDATALILSRFRLKACLEWNLSNEEEVMDPPCVTEWSCFFEYGEKCDYGMQAKFIYDVSPAQARMEEEIRTCLMELRSALHGQLQGTIDWRKEQAVWKQRILQQMVQTGLLAGYTMEPEGDHKRRFLVLAQTEFWAEGGDDPKIRSVVEAWIAHKKDKLRSLEKMRRYVEQDGCCRKQTILDYFEDPIKFGPKGCGKCDVDGKPLISMQDMEMEDTTRPAEQPIQPQRRANDPSDGRKVSLLILGVLLLWWFF